MSFAGIDKLYRHCRIIYNCIKSVKVGKKKMCPLVCSEPAGKSYCQYILVEMGADIQQLPGTYMPVEHLALYMPSYGSE